MKHLFALMLVASFGFVACDSIFPSDDCNCERNIACTEEFKMIAIQVVDSDNNPITLNNYKVTYTKSGKEVDMNNAGDRLIAPSSYIIATDAMMDDLDCDGTSLTFEYSVDGKAYEKEKFLVGKDCCHIQWRDEQEQKLVIE